MSSEEQDVSELLFNLSSSDRLNLLTSINSEKQRATSLAKTINASAQECSRHLARLGDSGFIKKDGEGFYVMTSLGRSVLKLFPGLEFLLRYKDYFLSHDLSFLPQGYEQRIGELTKGEYVNHLSSVLDLIKSVISSAREYVLLISDKPIVVGNIGSSFHSRDLPVRLVAEETIDRKLVGETKAALPKSEVATLKEVNIAMAINENMAGVCFPGADKKIDFGAGFTSCEPQFRGWCADLFEYYWSKARRL